MLNILQRTDGQFESSSVIHGVTLINGRDLLKDDIVTVRENIVGGLIKCIT